ncbi:MAG TPA: dTDP-4-dehydrorhamnose 3,5-epimerase [Acetobacteraceae bacterium]|nr:dTDP-4-dehydrorhamnose 3,5-epimerase [Acetobacteraceae bacterium]
MQIEPQSIPEVLLITPRRFGDDRGFVSETFRISRLAEAGVALPFVQDNHTFSAAAGTVRGLHAQQAPSVQGKLIRVTRGAIWDVAVDVRHGSPSFGRHVAAELSAENWRQLWIPPGFLHGLCTLVDDTEIVYKMACSEYAPATECGALWNDPDLALPWPVPPEKAILSEKDRARPRLAECPAWFTYEFA